MVKRDFHHDSFSKEYACNAGDPASIPGSGRSPREGKSKGEKERYKHLNAEFQRIARRDKKAFFSDQCKEIKENNRMGRLEISSRMLEIPREHFIQRWA